EIYHDAEDSSINLNLNSENIEIKKYRPNDIRSIEILKNDDDECNNNDVDDIDDIIGLPEVSNIKRKENKFYQHHLPIDDGIYDGTINEESLREGQGTYSINNGKEYYSGSWKDDKPNGYGVHLKDHGLTIYHCIFEEGTLKEGYGKVQISKEYEYKGESYNGEFNGLGSLSIKKEGKTEIVYRNDLEEYYKKQSKVFYNTLQDIILLNNENQQNQKKYFQNLIDLFEKRLSNLNLLKEITTNTILPPELKLSADLLYNVDDSYTKLSKYTIIDTKTNYNNCINEICLRGLKVYARRLAWSDDENKNHFISDKNIFDNSLNEFLTKLELSDLKKILCINPFVVDLVKKLIHFANGRAIKIFSQYRTYFINIHIKFLGILWNNYLKNLDYNNISNKFDYKNDEKYHLYSDCYSNLLELSLLNEFEIEIKLEVHDQNSYISVKCNEEYAYHNTSNDKQLKIIIFDGAIGNKKSEEIFNIEERNNIHFVVEDINPNDIVVYILPFNGNKSLDIEIIKFFHDLGSTKIDKLKENETWICVIRKSDNKIYEEISCNSEQKLLIKEKFQFKLENENTLGDKKIIKNDIESIIYK
ncbi:unnamed protein product, partial [Didymodactylos carnosus]